jgi:DNA-binding NtrC family response regulator
LLADMERTLIQAAIERSGGDRQKAAHMLGIGKTTIYRKLKEYQRLTTGRRAS